MRDRVPPDPKNVRPDELAKRVFVIAMLGVLATCVLVVLLMTLF